MQDLGDMGCGSAEDEDMAELSEDSSLCAEREEGIVELDVEYDPDEPNVPRDRTISGTVVADRL